VKSLLAQLKDGKAIPLEEVRAYLKENLPEKVENPADKLFC
jgi:hypothetical protein